MGEGEPRRLGLDQTYVDLGFEALSREIDELRDAMNRQIDSAAHAHEYRFAAFREGLQDVTARLNGFLARDVYDQRHANLQERIKKLEDFQTDTPSRLSTFLTRDVYDQRHLNLDDRIAKLEQFQANTLGRLVAVSVLGAVTLALMSAFVTHLLGA